MKKKKEMNGNLLFADGQMRAWKEKKENISGKSIVWYVAKEKSHFIIKCVIL